MSWRDLLSEDSETVLPWIGGRKLYAGQRTWRIVGTLPDEHGWHRFRTAGSRDATWVGEAEACGLELDHPVARGYLVGDRLIPDAARVDPDPTRLIAQTVAVHLVEPGLERFARAAVARLPDGRHLYLRPEFPLGPEPLVLDAWVERRPDVNDIPGVTPALDLAYRWLVRQRELAEARAVARERERVAAEARAAEAERARVAAEAERAETERIARAVGTGSGRRALATSDFEAAARAALSLTGAHLLDCRPSARRGEMVVQYRFRQRRLECVVEADTLRVVDSGICLTDERTGERGDRYFTLESLPAVVGEAIESGRLVVYRHV